MLIGAFAALASFALFHLATVFPLSGSSGFRTVHHRGAERADRRCLPGGGAIMLGLAGRPHRAAQSAGRDGGVDGLFSFAAPWLLGAGSAGNNVFLLAGFVLLGLSYGQASGTVTANFRPSTATRAQPCRPTWPGCWAQVLRRWWRWGCRPFGLGAGVGVFAVGGGVYLLAALRINRLD